jgi:hypothetical protein
MLFAEETSNPGYWRVCLKLAVLALAPEGVAEKKVI